MQKEKSILLIDDDNAANFIHRIVIEESELIGNVISYEDPTAALDYLKDISNSADYPSVILLDINMPIMDGWEFLESCEKSLPNLTDHSMICMLSSSIIGRDIIKAEAHPMVSDYMSKPLTIIKFKAILQLLKNSLPSK